MNNFPKPLLVFVHPGSLCGSFQTAHDWHPKWSRYAETRRAQICAEFTFLDAHKVAVLGTELDDEIVRYPAIRTAVAKAQREYRAGPQEEELRKVVRKIWQAHSSKAQSICVTGAWADPGDGCAWTIYREFRRLVGKEIPVRLSALAACHDISRREIERGPVHPLGNSTNKVRWHVGRDSAAFSHNERLLAAHSRTKPAWRELGGRLKLIGGMAVCATFEEDMKLILREGKTWLARQKEIVLVRGEDCRCHQNVLHLWERNRGLDVCTGYALSKDGIWRSHSWCFDCRRYWIIETTEKRVAYHGAALGRKEILRRLSEDL
jgi:hypothetical protein